MTITLSPPIGFSYIGERNYNDDSIFPSPEQVNTKDNLFLVCDGVGGNATGYIASKLACVKMKEYIDLHAGEVLSDTFFQQAIMFVYDAFVNFERENPNSKGMATTLTLIYVQETVVWLVHLGDSRIYHIRNGQILHKTKDHSFVAELAAAGIISEEEARIHPKKNVISRAIQSAEPHKLSPDVCFITEICTNDSFFLCTDGVLESVTDAQLAAILGSEDNTNATKMQLIFKLCAANSKDNFSCYLIPIEIGCTEYFPTQSAEIIETDAFMGIIDSKNGES